ncbi:MAG: hypothetical protein KDK00_13415 [Rhodobacteraceae bacterium]|nr:hypothetical protein [Paracoccaceae bacterium]
MKILCKLGWFVSLILAGVIAYGAYVVMVPGHTAPSSDGRTAVLLAEGERDKVLGEMRVLLETVQAISENLAAGNVEAVPALARAAGMAAAAGESPAMMAKLPLEFKTLGLGTHQAFDDLADMAAMDPEPLEVLATMSQTMLNCTACHAGYRLAVEDSTQ